MRAVRKRKEKSPSMAGRHHHHHHHTRAHTRRASSVASSFGYFFLFRAPILWGICTSTSELLSCCITSHMRNGGAWLRTDGRAAAHPHAHFRTGYDCRLAGPRIGSRSTNRTIKPVRDSAWGNLTRRTEPARSHRTEQILWAAVNMHCTMVVLIGGPMVCGVAIHRVLGAR